MDKNTALDLFNAIEQLRIPAYEDEGEDAGMKWQETAFNVRLDAGTVEGLDLDQEGEQGAPYCVRRTWRIFVTWGGSKWTSGDLNEDWEDVIKAATERGVEFRPENNGLALG